MNLRIGKNEVDYHLMKLHCRLIVLLVLCTAMQTVKRV